ncbi:unnamed protein product [Lupinus luteus]|uniref:Aspergillus nuclease S1 n=1 Tax=Lupinus luteus TaxID=3873 RepID=A0AAV1XI51_LUPLU
MAEGDDHKKWQAWYPKNGKFGGVVFTTIPGALSWSKEGHMMTCQIAQALLEPQASEDVSQLLPEYVQGDLSALCVWPDQIRHRSELI